MEFDTHPALNHIVDKVKGIINSTPNLASELRGMQFSIGKASDSRYQIESGARGSPIAVGDSLYGERKSTAALDAMFKRDPNSVRIKPVYNERTRKYDMYLVDAKRPSVGDAAPNLIGAQLLSPNGVNSITNVFVKPLIKSVARRLCSVMQGDNPWAEVMSLYLADFSGFAAMPTAGASNNNMSTDVESVAGIMTTPIINISATYRISVEEEQRASASGRNLPYSGQLIAYKQRYADWVLDMITNVLTYYGNTSTETEGLLTAGDGVTAWPYDSLKEIRDGSSTTKGSDAYQNFANVLAEYLTTNQNMLNKVVVAMSPEAYNIGASLAYSSEFSPQAVWKTVIENFLSGMDTDGITPDIEIVADPLLSANTTFNTNDYDLMLISSPEIKGGPDYQSEPLIGLGIPLDKFVYPVVAGMYGTPYKTLRRFSGIFLPYTPAIKAYSGFGTTDGS